MDDCSKGYQTQVPKEVLRIKIGQEHYDPSKTQREEEDFYNPESVHLIAGEQEILRSD